MEYFDTSFNDLKSDWEETNKDLEELNNTVVRKVRKLLYIIL